MSCGSWGIFCRLCFFLSGDGFSFGAYAFFGSFLSKVYVSAMVVVGPTFVFGVFMILRWAGRPFFRLAFSFPSTDGHVSGQFRYVEGFQFPSAEVPSVWRFQFPRMTDSRDATGPPGGFGLRVSACGASDCCHGFIRVGGFSVSAGGKDFALGFTPVARGGCFISECDFPRGGMFGDLHGSLIGMVYEKEL